MSSSEMNFYWQSIYEEIDGKLCILRLSFIATLLFWCLERISGILHSSYGTLCIGAVNRFVAESSVPWIDNVLDALNIMLF